MKVLVVSHNPFSTFQSMGKTFCSLFSSFSKDELCQIYIYPSFPDIDCCTSYLRITDYDIIHSFFHFCRVHSQKIVSADIKNERHDYFEKSNKSRILQKTRKTNFSLLCRDIAWKCSRWFNSDVKEWLAEQAPTCLFLAPGESKFLYDIGLKIADYLNIPIVLYICDEFFFASKRKKIIGNLELALLQRKIKKTIRQSSCLITICEELAQQYSESFDKETFVVYSGSTLKKRENVKYNANIISYFGNLSLNRFKSILEVGEAIDVINHTWGTCFELHVYCPFIDKEIEKQFARIQSIRLCGFVAGSLYLKMIYKSCFLLHVESFQANDIERTRHSISTKIPDSLSVGIPLIAYGPEGIASIDYLNKNQCAFVISKSEDLIYKLNTILFNQEERERIVSNALNIAELNHDSKNNSLKLKRIIRMYT